MRSGKWVPLSLLLLGLSTPAWAQQPAPSSFLSRSSPQFQPVNTPSLPTAPSPLQDKFSIRRLLSKAFPFFVSPPPGTVAAPSPVSLPSLQVANPLVPQPTANGFSGVPVTGPFGPLPPTTVLPIIKNDSPIQPLLPTTVLPIIKNDSPFQPLPPIVPGR